MLDLFFQVGSLTFNTQLLCKSLFFSLSLLHTCAPSAHNDAHARASLALVGGGGTDGTSSSISGSVTVRRLQEWIVPN